MYARETHVSLSAPWGGGMPMGFTYTNTDISKEREPHHSPSPNPNPHHIPNPNPRTSNNKSHSSRTHKGRAVASVNQGAKPPPAAPNPNPNPYPNDGPNPAPFHIIVPVAAEEQLEQNASTVIVNIQRPPIGMEIVKSRDRVILASFSGEKLDNRLVEGCMLVFVNDEQVSSRNAQEIVSFLAAYGANSSGAPLRLTFDISQLIDPAALARDDETRNKEFGSVDDETLNSQWAGDSAGVIRIIRSRIDFPLPNQLLLQLCQTCGWNLDETVVVIRNIVEEYRDLVESIRQRGTAVSEDVRKGISSNDDPFPLFPAVLSANGNPHEYYVIIKSRYLGMTVENVKERTIVRSVKPISEAAEIGVVADSLLVRIGDIDTHTLSHTETLETLRQSTRPVQLKFRIVNPQKLQQRRAEMRALVYDNAQKSDKHNQTQLLEWCEERIQAVLRLLCVTCAINEQNHADIYLRGLSHQPSPAKWSNKMMESLTNLLSQAHEAISNNVRREALVGTRICTLGEILNEMMKQIDWEDDVIWFIEKDVRDIACTLLQLDTDQVFGPASQCGQPGAFLEKIISCLSETECIYQCSPLLWRLACAKSVSSRIACANLVPKIYERLPLSEQLCLRGMLNRLVADENVLVRANAVCVAALLLPIVDLSGLHWLVILSEIAAEDEDWSVRLRALEGCLNFLRATPPALQGLSSPRDLTSDGEVQVNGRSSQFPHMEDPTLRPLSTTATETQREMHLMQCRMLPVVTRLAEDGEAKVRAAVAMKCHELCSLMPHWTGVVVDLVLALLRDKDLNVQIEALIDLPRVCEALLAMSESSKHTTRSYLPLRSNSKTVSGSLAMIFDSLIPCVLELQADASVRMRVILAGSLADLLHLLCSIDRSVDYPLGNQLRTLVVPVLMSLLGDSNEQVAATMLGTLIPVGTHTQAYASWSRLLFSPENTSMLLRALENLGQSPRWRTRQAVSCVLPLLVSACHTVEGRESAAQLARPLLHDSVFEVRKTAAYCICRAAAADFLPELHMVELTVVDELDVILDGNPLQDMGRMWLDGVALPQVETLRTSCLYSDRVMALHMIATLLSDVLIKRDVARCDILINIALTLASDPVPNVKLALAQALGMARELLLWKKDLDDGVFGKVDETLTSLSVDTDRDVRHFAAQTQSMLA